MAVKGGAQTGAYKETKSQRAKSGVGGAHSTDRGHGKTEPGPREGALLCTEQLKSGG